MMQKAISVFLVSLLLLTSFTYNFGLVLSAKEKRGWTLNSAGYLLGPHAVDNHRSFIEKHGLAGKRELQTEENTKLGNFLKTWMDDKVLHTIIEFLTYLHLKDGCKAESEDREKPVKGQEGPGNIVKSTEK